MDETTAVVHDVPEGVELPQVPGYRVTRWVGQGGSAHVWRARRLDDDSLVALKVLSPLARMLVALGNAVTASMGQHPVYLWTLPMFHCNGWCTTWALVGIGGGSMTVPLLTWRDVPPVRAVGWAALNDPARALAMLNMVRDTAESFELISADALDLVLSHFPAERRPVAARALLPCSGPIMCSSTPGYAVRQPGHLACASWT